MFNKRLLKYMNPCRSKLFTLILFKVVSLLTDIAFAYALTRLFVIVIDNRTLNPHPYIVLFCTVAVIKYISYRFQPGIADSFSKTVKTKLRYECMQKIFKVEGYARSTEKAKLMQTLVEGIEQLDIYFSQFLPQLIISMLTPLILAVVLGMYSVKTALVMLVLLPLTPLSLALIGMRAKKIMEKYWYDFSDMSEQYLENLEGLTTLKIYSADNEKERVMQKYARDFRIVTMKLLKAQLNSIWVLDFLTLGCAAVGIFMAVYFNREIGLEGTVMISALSINYFLPMRRLGSFFHIAMNGIAASTGIFAFLDLPEYADIDKPVDLSSEKLFEVDDMSFSYDDRPALRNVSFNIKKGSITGICGESGSGKSTIAKLLTRELMGSSGRIKLLGTDIGEVNISRLREMITVINFNSYIFKGSVRENLNLGGKDVDDDAMLNALETVKLKSYFDNENGLDTPIDEGGSNLSGGQRQRLALARALVKNSPIYILDEATSNIDSSSEKFITDAIYSTPNKTWIIISHRLQNIVRADSILVFKDGRLAEEGTHDELISKNGEYKQLYAAQEILERKAGVINE